MEERAPLLYFEHAGKFEEMDGRCAPDSRFKAGAASWSIHVGPDAQKDEQDSAQSDVEMKGQAFAEEEKQARESARVTMVKGVQFEDSNRIEMEAEKCVGSEGPREGQSLRDGGLGDTMSKFLLETSDRYVKRGRSLLLM